jgi:hypothetical protein
LELVGHAQWVCAAYLIADPIPEELPHLREYFRRFTGSDSESYW